MAVTLAVFAAVQIIMPNVVRPHLIPPAHATSAIAYQPASRYWALQWYETTIFLALALAGFCIWWIRHPRRS
jgi:hypothetical protein